MQYPKRNGLNYDPVEDTEAYKEAIKDIEKKLKIIMEDFPNGMGSCHIYWAQKKKLLVKAG
jgi:hypothetical protein